MSALVDLLRLLLVGLALLTSAAAAFGCLWIVLPAPHPRVAWWAIVAAEGSLWLLGLALLGVALSLVALLAGAGSAAWAALALGGTATALALIPPLQAAAVARAHGARLGFHPDLFGRRDGPGWLPPETVPFALVAGRSLTLDVYRPTPGADAAAPAVVVVHGGGWTAGGKGEQAQWNVWLARQGFVVFDVEYRLAPPPTWQAAPGDVTCAVGWVKRHAAEYGADPARVALLGRSAGAQLALLAAYTPGHGALPASCDGDPCVRAVVELYGPTDLARMHDRPAPWSLSDGRAMLRGHIGGDPRAVPDRYALASPTTHVGPNTPPTLLVHGGRDQYVGAEHVTLLAERLDAAGVPFRTVVLPYAHHTFDYVWNGWGSQALRPILLDFLRTYMRRTSDMRSPGASSRRS